MIPVNLRFKSIEAVGFDKNSDLVDIRVVVSDGKPADKAVTRSIRIEDPMEQAAELVAEIKNKIKSLNMPRFNTNEPLSGIIVLRVVNKEADVVQKIARLMARVKESVQAANAKSSGNSEKKVLMNARMEL
jgi:hypothetical protein